MPKSTPVHRYSMEGKYLNSYPHAAQAGRELYINPTVIRKACQNKIYRSAGGYRWSFEKVEQLDVPYIRHTPKQPVHMYSLEGEYLKTFNTVHDAKHIASAETIRHCLRGHTKTAGEKRWTYEKMDALPPIDYRYKDKSKAVIATDLLTKKETFYQSINDAAYAHYTARQTIKAAIRKNYRSLGHYWRFATPEEVKLWNKNTK